MYVIGTTYRLELILSRRYPTAPLIEGMFEQHTRGVTLDTVDHSPHSSIHRLFKYRRDNACFARRRMAVNENAGWSRVTGLQRSPCEFFAIYDRSGSFRLTSPSSFSIVSICFERPGYCSCSSCWIVLGSTVIRVWTLKRRRRRPRTIKILTLFLEID